MRDYCYTHSNGNCLFSQAHLWCTRFAHCLSPEYNIKWEYAQYRRLLSHSISHEKKIRQLPLENISGNFLSFVSRNSNSGYNIEKFRQNADTLLPLGNFATNNVSLSHSVLLPSVPPCFLFSENLKWNRWLFSTKSVLMTPYKIWSIKITVNTGQSSQLPHICVYSSYKTTCHKFTKYTSSLSHLLSIFQMQAVSDTYSMVIS